MLLLKPGPVVAQADQFVDVPCLTSYHSCDAGRMATTNTQVPFLCGSILRFEDAGAMLKFFQSCKGYWLSRGWRQKPGRGSSSQPRTFLFLQPESSDPPILLASWMHHLRESLNPQEHLVHGSFIQMSEGMKRQMPHLPPPSLTSDNYC